MHPNAQAIARLLAEQAPDAEVRELDASTRTAAEAASALGCDVGAIANSLVFMAGETSEPLLIMTSGRHRVDVGFVGSELSLGPVRRATADEVRSATGQSIGGVAPIGHPARLRTLVDQWLARYPVIWAAAGTSHAVFSTTFAQLLEITGGSPVMVEPSGDGD